MNEVERLFRCLKGFRRIFSRLDKLDMVFVFFTHFALIFTGAKKCERALIASSEVGLSGAANAAAFCLYQQC